MDQVVFACGAVILTVESDMVVRRLFIMYTKLGAVDRCSLLVLRF